MSNWVLVKWENQPDDNRRFKGIWSEVAWREYRKDFPQNRWHKVAESDNKEELRALGQLLEGPWL